jgi:hypothetical protein
VLYDSGDRMSPGERLRFVLVLLGGILGICTALYGLALPFVEYREVFGGGFAEWRKHPGPLFWTALPLFGGLALTFISLMLTAGLERTSQRARQLLYGYNAVLSSLLLLFIFLLLNVFPYSGVWPFRALAQTSDWTSTGLYTLSPATKERLASINQPVKVIVLLNGVDPFNNFVETLLQHCHEINPRITWETLSRDLNFKQVEELVKKYQLTDPTGLIVEYGTKPNTTFEFIPRKDLGADIGTEDTSRFSFKGESALSNALTYLVAGKTKSIIYFTQGNGELDYNDRTPDRPDKGIGEIVDRLGKSNYDVKPLTFEVANPKVPDDADVVVVARPTAELPAGVVSALRSYAAGNGKKKGNLFILFDVVPTRDGKMARTGLEPLVTEFGVNVGNDRLLAMRSRNPLEVITIPNPKGSNPIARAFMPEGSFQAVPFRLTDVRTVTPAPPNPGAPSPYTAEPLLLALPEQLLVAEPDLNADVEVIASQLRENQDKLFEKIIQRAPSVAVTVSENSGAAPQIPGHEFMKQEGRPRMVVFGDASWASNREVEGRNGADNYDLFLSCVNWLRERPDLGTQAIEAKTRSEYRLPDKAYTTRLLLEPVALILLSVISLGTGVWVVRRR